MAKKNISRREFLDRCSTGSKVALAVAASASVAGAGSMSMLLSGCGGPAEDVKYQGKGTATSATLEHNATMAQHLPLADQQDFEQARKGLIATMEPMKIKGPRDTTAWDMEAYKFMQGPAPATVNPSLWRQGQLNNIHGLFKVTDGVYQLRGFDLANMSIIEGKTGWIIIDPLTTKETAAAALAFARKQLGDKPIRAVIFTHTHIDHFGGALGVLSDQDIKGGNIKIVAPKGFMHEATSENLIAGTAMGRRAVYQFGRTLQPSNTGHVGSGLGKVPAHGSYGIAQPNTIVDHTPQEMVIDGVKFVFQYTPESEAPAELTFYLPEKKTFCGAEVVSRNMHNLYTLRGAKVRNALLWSNYIDQALQLFGDADIYFGCHHWPIWGNAKVVEFLKKQRDLYKYIHDQTVRLANLGLTPREIAEEIKLPESLSKYFANRGYYGTLSHNSKAVYQFYFGWYDGNPANLNPLPPVESAKRYMQYMGGADAVLKKAQESFNQGDYRFVAEVLNHVVFADPDNQQAKEMLAKTYEQMAYQAESGVWRNEYLTAARELRLGPPERGVNMLDAIDLIKQTPVERFFDSMAARLNGPDAEGKDLTINVTFTDLNESYVLTLENSVLHHRRAAPDPKANASIKITHGLFVDMLVGKVGIKDMVFSDELETDGSKMDLIGFLRLIEKPEGKFNIVTP